MVHAKPFSQARGWQCIDSSSTHLILCITTGDGEDVKLLARLSGFGGTARLNRS